MTDHAATAMSYLEATVIDTYGDHDRKAAIAQVHATIALVEEQRTANLIAWLAFQMSTKRGIDHDMADQIAASLGLTPTTPNQEQ